MHGFQNSSPLNRELDFVELFHRFGIRAMQLDLQQAECGGIRMLRG
jgi:hypothetical protein